MPTRLHPRRRAFYGRGLRARLQRGEREMEHVELHSSGCGASVAILGTLWRSAGRLCGLRPYGRLRHVDGRCRVHHGCVDVDLPRIGHGENVTGGPLDRSVQFETSPIRFCLILLSVSFPIVFLAGGVALQLSWLSLTGPITSTSCMVRPWVLSMSYSIMLGALIRKMFVVLKLLSVAKHMRSARTKPPNRRMNQAWSVLAICLMLLGDAVICIAWTIVSPAVPQAKSFAVPVAGIVSIPGYECGSASTHVFFYILVAYKIAITFTAAVVAFRVRAVGSSIPASPCESLVHHFLTIFSVGY